MNQQLSWRTIVGYSLGSPQKSPVSLYKSISLYFSPE